MSTSTVSRKALLWRAVKHLVTLAILLGVGYVFYDSLRRLDASTLQWQPAWLVVSGLAYLASMLVSMVYWWWSMKALGQQPYPLDVARAYFIGHLGKYVPGKALVIILRAGMVQNPACRPGLAAVTVVYETITLMAAGAIWFLLVLCWTGPWERLAWWQVAMVAGVLCLPTPWLFNPLLKKLVAPFRHVDAAALPDLNYLFLLLGLLFGLVAWLFMGLSLAAAIRAVTDTVPIWTGLALLTAQFAAATVIGWIVPTPGGLGAREGMLLYLLQETVAEGPAALVPLLLRLTWIVTELVLSGLLYPLRWIIPVKKQAATDLPAPGP